MAISYAPFGRHVAVLALAGPCIGTQAREQLIRATARAVEADRTSIVIDSRDAATLGVEVISAIQDIDRAAMKAGWRVALVRPGQGVLRDLFREIDLDLAMPVFTTRATAILWTMARRGARVRSARVVAEPSECRVG
jgi:hypothetical protein